MTSGNQKLKEAIFERKPCDFRAFSDEDKLSNSDAWGPDRIIEADFLRAILVGEQEIAPSRTSHAYEIVGARVSGFLDFRTARLDRPLYLRECVMDEMDATDAHLSTILLDRCQLARITARRAQIDGSFLVKKCEVTGTLDALAAHTKGDFDLSGSRFRPGASVLADRAKVDGAVYLDGGFQCNSEVSFSNARVGSVFNADGATFRNANGPALTIGAADIGGVCILSGATIESSSPEGTALAAGALKVRHFLSISRASVKGKLMLYGADIGGNLDLGATAIESAEIALDLAQAKLAGSMLVGPVTDKKQEIPANIVGRVRMSGAAIGGNLIIEKATIQPNAAAVQNSAIEAENLTVGHFVSLYRSSIKGQVFLRGAHIGASLNLTAAQLETKGLALDLERATIGGDVFIRPGYVKENGQELKLPSAIAGAIRLLSASVEGNLIIADSSIVSNTTNGPAFAIEAENLRVKHFMSLSKASVEGQVFLRGAQIGANLNLSGAFINNPMKCVLDLERAKVGGDLLMNPVEVPTAAGPSKKPTRIQGRIIMTSARIGGSLIILDAALCDNSSQAQMFNRMNIEAVLVFSPSEVGNGRMSLANTKVGALADNIAMWPSELVLSGFDYGRFSGDAPVDWRQRLAWLRRHKTSNNEFNAQRFAQLIAVLRRSGHDKDARMIAIGRQREARRRLSASSPRWWGNLLMEATCGHGYRPWLAAVWAAIVIGIGWIVFDRASNEFVPLKDAALNQFRAGKLPQDYPPFRSFIYSADTFLPIVNLQQKDYWGPDASKPSGYLAWGYRPIHILAGWFFTTLFVAGVTGLIRRE